MVDRNAKPYPDTASFISDLDQGMVPQDRYYATLSAWLRDGTALTTRGRVIKKLAMEQWKQGVMSVDGVINWSVVSAQTPHYVFGQEEDYTLITGASVNSEDVVRIYMRAGGRERKSNRKLLGCPYIDRDTVDSPYYNRPKGGKRRTVYDKDGFARPERD